MGLEQSEAPQARSAAKQQTGSLRYAVPIAAGRPYFVMELVRGEPIMKYCDDNRLSLEERLELFVQFCQAVQHAHQKGVIHRDLKPSNILVAVHYDKPVPKVIDFGIAKALQQRLTEKTLFTRFNQFIGTPAYMRPEQAGLSSLDIDTRSDIYSLGVLLYELLTGRTPFSKEELLAGGYDEICLIIREKEPPKPSTRLSTLSAAERSTIAAARKVSPEKLGRLVRGELDWVVMKALEKDRARRDETANALVSDIQRYLHQEPATARPWSTADRLQEFVRRNKLAYAVASAVFSALLIEVVVSAGQAVRATRAERAERAARIAEAGLRKIAERSAEEEGRARSELEVNLYVSDMKAAQQAWDVGNMGALNDALNRHVPPAGQADHRGFEWFLLKAWAGGDQEHVLRGHTSDVLDVALSRDGLRLASISTNEVKLWDLSTRVAIATWPPPKGTNPQPVADPDPRDYAVSFTFDGKLLIAGGANELQLFDPNSAQLAKVSVPGRARGALASPNAPFVLLRTDAMASQQTRTLTVWNYDSANVVFATNVDQTAGFPLGAWAPEGRMLALPVSHEELSAYEATTWQLRWRCRVQPYFSALAFSPDGSKVAVAGFKGLIDLIDTASGKITEKLESGNSTIALAYSPDGKRLARGGEVDLIQLFDLPAGSRLRQSQREQSHWHRGFSPVQSWPPS